jgi:hypothetical protein
MDKLETLVSVLTSASIPCYAYEKPKGVDSCITYHLISSQPLRDNKKVIWEKSRVQIDVWGESLSACRTLAGQVKGLLDNDSTHFKLSQYFNDFCEKDTENGLFRNVVEFFIY